ncbi:hypothetical protein KGQ71_04785 [Patescibacteria group bacterium]|nr:hypothetical protein [Patescibacteria group bacterium]
MGEMRPDINWSVRESRAYQEIGQNPAGTDQNGKLGGYQDSQPGVSQKPQEVDEPLQQTDKSDKLKILREMQAYVPEASAQLAQPCTLEELDETQQRSREQAATEVRQLFCQLLGDSIISRLSEYGLRVETDEFSSSTINSCTFLIHTVCRFLKAKDGWGRFS